MRSGIDLAAKRIVERPVGALGAFTTRSAMADEFTVGWVGRPVVHGGTDIKRVAWFVDAVRAAGGPLRAVLLGERLESAHTALRRRGIDCRYLRKSVYPIERYPQHLPGLRLRRDLLEPRGRPAHAVRGAGERGTGGVDAGGMGDRGSSGMARTAFSWKRSSRWRRTAHTARPSARPGSSGARRSGPRSASTRSKAGCRPTWSSPCSSWMVPAIGRRRKGADEWRRATGT
ncbi:MAG: hypothetical protein MZW92_40675 [Comamonadaceae bacterium]|nr:hypothetical protein [Comamonadaceae bacterium]